MQLMRAFALFLCLATATGVVVVGNATANQTQKVDISPAQKAWQAAIQAGSEEEKTYAEFLITKKGTAAKARDAKIATGLANAAAKATEKSACHARRLESAKVFAQQSALDLAQRVNVAAAKAKVMAKKAAALKVELKKQAAAVTTAEANAAALKKAKALARKQARLAARQANAAEAHLERSQVSLARQKKNLAAAKVRHAREEREEASKQLDKAHASASKASFDAHRQKVKAMKAKAKHDQALARLASEHARRLQAKVEKKRRARAVLIKRDKKQVDAAARRAERARLAARSAAHGKKPC